MDKVERSLLGAVGLAIIAVIILLTIIFVGPIYEMDRYEKMTGDKATYAEAFFLDLDPSKHKIILEK